MEYTVEWTALRHCFLLCQAEQRSRRRCMAEGIVLPGIVYEELRSLCEKCGVSFTL